jgi:hypothetical protein
MNNTSNSNKNPQNKKFLIGGIARNCGKTIKDDVLYLQNALINYPNKHWLIIESDSDDNTIEVLRELETMVENFRFISLGTMRNRIPDRTKRIAYCRNKYMEEFDSDPEYQNSDYVIIADFDGVNTCITDKSISSCWERDDWSVATANQWGPYYDIFALRHPLWSPNNCWESQIFLGIMGMTEDDSKFVAVYSRMFTIPEEGEWIEVDSAFGGLAVYKAEVIKGLRYVGSDSQGNEMCEHVNFHQLIKERGGRIFINPHLINAELTDHSIQFLEWQKSRK